MDTPNLSFIGGGAWGTSLALAYTEKFNTILYKRNYLENDATEKQFSNCIEKEKRNVEKLIRLRNIKIPEKFNFNELSSLSFEAKEKLNKIRPQTLAQASRISGIKPSDISVLLVSMGR